MGSAFVHLLQKSVAILKPISKLITVFQSNRIHLSEVYPSFKNLVAEFQQVPEMCTDEKNYAIN